LRVVRFLHFLHHFSAAAGDHLASVDVENFVADGAVDIARFFCPYHFNESAFQFHNNPF